MAITLVGTPQSVRSSTSPATTPTMDTTGADLLIVMVSHNDAAGGTPEVVDSKGNTWNPLTSWGSGTTGTCRIYWSKPSSVGTSHTATFQTGQTFAYASVWFAAFSGTHATPYDDPDSGASSTNTTSIFPGPLTPDQNDSLIITGLSITNLVVGPATISGGGFSAVEGALTSGSPDNGAQRGAFAYIVQGTAAQSSPEWAWGGSGIAAASAIAVFKPTASGNLSVLIGEPITGSSVLN